MIFITVQWYLRNQEIDANDPNLEVLSLGPLGVLRVNPISKSYFGDYTCQATNPLGKAEWDLKLKEAHVPGPISDAKVINVYTMCSLMIITVILQTCMCLNMMVYR